ncbi:hypothetical protein JB92DRAFT_2828501 [Gautieria morchelliformis]|nr:hypothetical protein JB92DRAFT_2828501 [Gautieria morchelliformis]
MVKPLYDKPPKHVTDMFLCKNWSSLAYETRKHHCELVDNSPTNTESDSQIDPTLKPTKCKPATDPSSDEDIYTKRPKTAVPSSNSTRKYSKEPAVRNGQVEINVTSALNDYEQEQEHERDEKPWSGSHNRKKENIQTIAGLEGNRWTKHLVALLGLNDKELELKKTLQGYWLSGEGSETTDWESSSPSATSSSLLSEPKYATADVGLAYMPGTSRMNTLNRLRRGEDSRPSEKLEARHRRSSKFQLGLGVSSRGKGAVRQAAHRGSGGGVGDAEGHLNWRFTFEIQGCSTCGGFLSMQVKDEQQETWVMVSERALFDPPARVQHAGRARNSIIVMSLRLEKSGGEQGMKETLHVIELWDNLQEERSCFEGSETL